MNNGLIFKVKSYSWKETDRLEEHLVQRELPIYKGGDKSIFPVSSGRSLVEYW